MAKTKIAVLVSGGGTNLQALIDAQGSVLNSGEITLVVSNARGAYALERAAKAGIATETLIKKELGGQEAFETRLMEILDANGIEVIILAGFITRPKRPSAAGLPMNFTTRLASSSCTAGAEPR